VHDARPKGWILLALISVAGLTLGCGRSAPRPECSLEGTIGTICGFRNPEDLEYVPSSDLIVVSNMRFDGRLPGGGYLSGFQPGTTAVRRLWPAAEDQAGGDRSADIDPDLSLGASDCTGPPAKMAFYPHGLTSRTEDGVPRIYVAAHAGKAGGREAIEIFELRGRGASASLVWRACIPTHPSFQANDIAIGPDGAVVVSNYQPDGSMLHMFEAMVLGRDTGNIMRWTPELGWRRVEGTAAALPNGVAVSPQTRMIFYTETATGKIHRIPADGGRATIDVSIVGNPDNLTWTPRGTLLVATHTGGPAFLLCALGRKPCTTSWEVDELDPRTMALQTVFVHDGKTIGAVATALQVEGRIYLSSVFDDRIGVIPLAH